VHLFINSKRKRVCGEKRLFFGDVAELVDEPGLFAGGHAREMPVDAVDRIGANAEGIATGSNATEVVAEGPAPCRREGRTSLNKFLILSV
jgi:hypothetical protein